MLFSCTVYEDIMLSHKSEPCISLVFIYPAQNGNDFPSFFLSTPAKRTKEFFSKELLSCLFFKVNFEF